MSEHTLKDKIQRWRNEASELNNKALALEDQCRQLRARANALLDCVGEALLCLPKETVLSGNQQGQR